MGVSNYPEPQQTLLQCFSKQIGNLKLRKPKRKADPLYPVATLPNIPLRLSPNK
jgi:hypothetical protein